MKFKLILYYFLLSFGLFSQVKPEVVLTTGHNDQINAMVVSSDNKYLASAGNNKIIKIWDIASNKEFRSFSGFDGTPNELAFSQDNQHLVLKTHANELIIWNVKTGEEVFKTSCGTGFLGMNFFNNGKELVYMNEDSKLTVLDFEKKTTQVIDKETYITGLTVDPIKSIAYCSDSKGNFLYYDLVSKTLTKTVQLFEKNVFTLLPYKLSKDGKYIVNPFNDNKLRVIDVNQGKIIYESPVYDTKIMAFEMDAKDPYVYYTLHSGEVVIFDYVKHKKVESFKDPDFIANTLATYSSGGVLILANFNKIRFYNTKNNTFFKIFETKISKIENIAYDQQGKYMAVASHTANIEIWDLRLNKIVTTLHGFFPCQFSPDGQELLTMHYSMKIRAWDVNTWEKKFDYDNDNELVQKLTFSPDGKYIAASGFNQMIKIWERDKEKTIKKLKGHTHGILGIDFHPTKPILASASHDETVRIWDFLNEKEIQKFTDQTIVCSGVKFSPDGKYLASSSWDKTILIRKTDDWSIQNTLKGHENMILGLDYNKKGDVLVSYAGNNSVWKSDNSLIFWDTKTGDIIARIKDHQSEITQAFFDLDADYVFSSSNDGTVRISDYKKKKTLATYVSVGNNEFMIYTPENYYMSSKQALKSVAFRINGELVPFEQFDIMLNRPDIVAKSIGKSPDQLIRAYEYLYKKRLRKYDLDEGSIKLDYQIPKILNEEEVPLVTQKESIKLTIKCWDEIYTVSQINIYVNGTPIYGEKGFRINEKVKSFRKTFDVPLLAGVNKIQISCLNSNGAESLYETYEVIKEKDLNKNNLYLLAIGVSNYKDSRFNLKYPTKDVKDVVQKMNEAKDLYSNIFTKTLIDEEVTLENFKKSYQFFDNCKHNDVVIIFIAGHGVLNVNFDYFYATYDMDFDNPDAKGLEYGKIHELLNQIKSYRKLLIMDTCHSGELDKEEIEKGPEPEVDESDIQFRNAGVAVREKEGFGFENSLELMNDLFSDTRKGSGATVISSAGGAEYAMESSQWKNGLFTYAFLSGLSDKRADYNNDGFIQISEIRRYVNENVKNLSGGKQSPSSREDNINLDYVIFAIK